MFCRKGIDYYDIKAIFIFIKRRRNCKKKPIYCGVLFNAREFFVDGSENSLKPDVMPLSSFIIAVL